ncbi:hypothetical protein AX16_002936 [Volvariella volvacea WC 439]|nr:hypothetical protein AX16_002936 [Volvariella volvacea WC 439]
MSSLASSSRLLARLAQRRAIHQSHVRRAITNLEMPAMSPTMTEGGISSWKKREGEAFSAGDVLLEIETDKATIDVEAQDDGVMGKILLPDGTKNVPVGKIIALLAEEGDDISNLQAPPEDTPKPKPQAAAEPPTPAPQAPAQPSPQPATSHAHPSSLPTHSRPLFPSVHRLILEYGITNLDGIKGTGVRGMLTKGDVLAHLGKASSPTGTFKEKPAFEKPQLGTASAAKKEEVKALDGPALRRLIVSNMLQNSLKAKTSAPQPVADFDSIIADYLPSSPKTTPKASPPSPPPPAKSAQAYFDGLI